MTQRQRSRLAAGLILVIVGGVLLAAQFIPSLDDWIEVRYEWPVWIIGFGILMFIIGLLTNAPGFAVPAIIIAGLGGIFYWQVLNDDFASWSYMWTLFPGLAGLGGIVTGLLSRRERASITGGLQLILVSLVMFAVFGSLFGQFSGVVQYWPILLILYGVVLLFRMLFRKT